MSDKNEQELPSFNLGDLISSLNEKSEYSKFVWKGSFEEYLNILSKNPKCLSSSWLRVYNMIVSHGQEDIYLNKKKIKKYNFFSNHPKYPIFGLEEELSAFVDIIYAGALGYGPERRVLLLHGPVGSSKSTICTLLKRGLEEYSRTDDGAVYTYSWNVSDFPELSSKEGNHVDCPLHEDPLNILPKEYRKAVIDRIFSKVPVNERFEIDINASLCPKCQFYFDFLMNHYSGDLSKVLSHVTVKRFIFDEKTRKGIGTFQPKDEKNQDATELTGDINFRKLGQIGIDSDPRCFNFDGEFQVANRGICEFIEMLKLSREFLYDLLGASQEKQIKPKKFSQMSIDELLIGHTNAHEFLALQQDKKMEALRDRTIKVDIPYLLKWDHEVKIYKHLYNANTVKQHISPHSLEIAALWAICTRLHEPKDNSVGIIDKVKLYNGQDLPGMNEDRVKEIRDSTKGEGMTGISARFIQNAISNVLVNHNECMNVFLILREISQKLENYSMINDENDRKRYKDLVSIVTREYDNIVRDEIQKALIGNDDAMKNLCSQYIDNITASVNKNKIENPITGREEAPSERLMRSIEEKIGINEQAVNDYRRSIVMHIGTLAAKSKQFDYKSNPQLMKALQLKLFEDTKDTIKLAKLSEGATTIDRETQDKIDAIKKRLKDQYGYCDRCAADILQYASSIFARGELE